MAKNRATWRSHFVAVAHVVRALLLVFLGAAGGVSAGASTAEKPASERASSAASGLPAATAAALPASAPPERTWVGVPRTVGRMTAADIGLVINTSDPYSVEVGEFYIYARKLSAAQVLRVDLPLKPVLTPEEFSALAGKIGAHFGDRIQALALAWTLPYAVGCNSITGALALGYDAALCAQSCAPSRPSRYFNTATVKPFSELKLRPSMLLAARDVDGAKALIERGVASDRTLGLRGAPAVHAHYLITDDRVRSVRAALFPPPGLLRRHGVDVHVDTQHALDGASRLLLYQTGLTRVDKLDTLEWVPGAVADHLTSFGGRLDAKNGQMSAIEWISSGATASYGSVSEPCAHLQKFPHPQLLLLYYLQGATVLEAYWKSVAWPQQGVFIGEPLAAPFSRR